jgi:hypothetical protein
LEHAALSKYISWTAAGFNVLAFAVYFPYASPNVTSWGLWAFIVTLNFSTYTKMTGDRVMSLLSRTSATLTIITFLWTLAFGQIKAMGIWDGMIFSVGVGACLVWYYKRSAAYAQLLVQACIAIGFIPNLTSVWITPSSEPSSAWFLWAVGFAAQGVVVWMRWKNRWQDAVYPVNCTFWHLLVGILALRA